MSKALYEKDIASGHRTSRARDWRRSMSDNVAFALLVYTGLQIFMTVNAMKDGVSSIVPYLALVILVGGIIPETDRQPLMDLGIKGVFGPGASTIEIVQFIESGV